MSFVVRNGWTEDDVRALPSGEHDFFERKSGRIFDNATDRNNLYDTLAKAASAFANSGGGHLILGVADDGTLDGVPVVISGKTTTRDWLEQKIPELVDYPINDFRVHRVVPSTNSNIPNGRELITIDFGDSSLAPHQSRRHTAYFYRSAGRSIHAPHFYLELLRQRMTQAQLDFKLERVEAEQAWRHPDEADASIVRIVATFSIENSGRVAAYKWALVARRIGQIPDGRQNDYLFGTIPGSPGRMRSIRVDDTLLPGCECSETKIFGVVLRPKDASEHAIRDEISALLSSMTFSLQLATETSPGPLKEILIGEKVDLGKIVKLVRQISAA